MEQIKQEYKEIKQTPNYSLGVGIATGATLNTDITYKIFNKKYGVVEVETTMLPQALKFLQDLEAGLAAMEDMYSSEKSESPVVPFHSGRSRTN